jgi:hypothetical protein
VLGVIIATPLWLVFGSAVHGSDSLRILASISTAVHDGPGFVVRSQEVLLPVFLMGAGVRLFGNAGAIGLSILSMQALVGVVSYITFSLTRRPFAALVSGLVLLNLQFLVRHAGALPMYPLMLAFGYLAGYVGLRSIRQENRTRRLGLAALTGLLLALTAEAHDIGKLFFVVPLLLLALEPSRRGVIGIVWIYAALTFFYIPRTAINLMEGGFTHFFWNRNDWMVARGYLTRVNQEFWGHAVDGSRGAYFATMGILVARGTGLVGALAPLFGLVALAAASWRVRMFSLLCAAVLYVGLVRTNAPPFPRYLAPLVPGVVLGAGVGVHRLMSSVMNVGRRRLGIIVAVVVSAVLLIGAAVTTVKIGAAASRARQRDATLIAHVAGHIPPGERVAGVRVSRLLSMNPLIRVVTTKSFTEREFVTYLTWPSDDEVWRVLRARDVRWLFVLRKSRLETDYHNTWVKPIYNRQVRHNRMLARSSRFCEEIRTREIILYRVNALENRPC